MAKGGTAAPYVPHRHASRRARAARTRALILAATAVVLMLTLGLVAFGFYRQNFLIPRTPVAIIDAEIIRAGEYHKRVRYQQLVTLTFLQNLQQQAQQATDEQSRQFYQALLANGEQQLRAVPYDVLEQMIEERLVAEEAQERDLAVGEEQVDQAIRARLGFATAEGEESEGAAADGDFEEAYADYLATLRQQAGLGESDFRALVRAELLRQELEKALQADIPARALHFYVKHIHVPDRESALGALGRIGAGESFEDVAREVSTDTSTKDQGGDLGWTPVGLMSAGVDDRARTLEPAEVSEPVVGRQGFHILKGVAEPTELPVEGRDRQQLEAQAYPNWLEQARREANVQRLLTPELIPAA